MDYWLGLYNLTSFVELSSKTGQNVEKAFDVMTETLIKSAISKKI